MRHLAPLYSTNQSLNTFEVKKWALDPFEGLSKIHPYTSIIPIIFLRNRISCEFVIQIFTSNIIWSNWRTLIGAQLIANSSTSMAAQIVAPQPKCSYDNPRHPLHACKNCCCTNHRDTKMMFRFLLVWCSRTPHIVSSSFWLCLFPNIHFCRRSHGLSRIPSIGTRQWAAGRLKVVITIRYFLFA